MGLGEFAKLCPRCGLVIDLVITRSGWVLHPCCEFPVGIPTVDEEAHEHDHHDDRR